MGESCCFEQGVTPFRVKLAGSYIRPACHGLSRAPWPSALPCSCCCSQRACSLGCAHRCHLYNVTISKGGGGVVWLAVWRPEKKKEETNKNNKNKRLCQREAPKEVLLRAACAASPPRGVLQLVIQPVRGSVTSVVPSLAYTLFPSRADSTAPVATWATSPSSKGGGCVVWWVLGVREGKRGEKSCRKGVRSAADACRHLRLPLLLHKRHVDERPRAHA